MSVVKFKLKEEHVKLVKHLEWKELTENKVIETKDEGSPFGGSNHYEDMGIILYGMPEEFDPFEGDPFDWTDEQKEEMDKLISEMPLALDIILNKQTFEIGTYKRKFNLREWKKIK